MNTKTISELVLEDGGLSLVFEKLGIDYCCGGNMTLEKACAKNGLDLASVSREIGIVRAGHHYAYTHSELWDLEFLIDYIVQNHHRYCKETMPVLATQLANLQSKHGHSLPFLDQVIELFQTASRELEQHTRKEEMILFPYIKSLASAKELGRLKPIAPFHTVRGPINHMQDQHAQMGETFATIRELMNNFQVPLNACATQRAAFYGLEEFEKDLHQHIHLENNLLFPMALKFEQELDLGEQINRMK